MHFLSHLASQTRMERLLIVLAAATMLLSACAERFKESLPGEAHVGSEAAATPGAADREQKSSAATLQQTVMDFSDRFTSTIWGALDRYIAEEPDVAKQVQAQRLKVALATASMTIAASKDPRANLLDMAVFVSAGKWAAERYWIPDVLGDKGAALAAAYTEMNRDIQAEVAQVLTPVQQTDLNDLIAAWKADNPQPRGVTDVRLRHLDGVVLKRFEESASARGLLANVRKWLGDVNQSLLYGERMMFYIERTPLILSQQADLTVDRVAERFPIATINPDFQQWSDLANSLPQQIRTAFENNQQALLEVLPGINGTLDSLAHISESLHGTAASADSLAAKIQQLPFGPEDYAAALAGASVSLDKLNGIVLGLNQLVDEASSTDPKAQATQLSHLIDEQAKRVMDDIFWRAAILIGLLIGGLLLVVIVARLLFRTPRQPSPDTKP